MRKLNSRLSLETSWKIWNCTWQYQWWRWPFLFTGWHFLDNGAPFLKENLLRIFQYVTFRTAFTSEADELRTGKRAAKNVMVWNEKRGHGNVAIVRIVHAVFDRGGGHPSLDDVLHYWKQSAKSPLSDRFWWLGVQWEVFLYKRSRSICRLWQPAPAILQIGARPRSTCQHTTWLTLVDRFQWVFLEIDTCSVSSL